MKKSLTKIFGVGLVLMLLVSLFGFAIPTSAGTISWSAEDIPSSTGNALVTTTGLKDIAVSLDGQTIYAATGTTRLYKSTNGGTTWTAITVAVAADLVAIAPDDTDLIAIAVTGTPAVYISTNGGSTWSTLGTVQATGGAAAAALTDLAISGAASGINYVAVSGTEAGPVANVWYFNIGAAAPAWTETNDKGGWGNADDAGTVSANVFASGAVAFSPNFPSDLTMIAITANATTGAVQVQLYSVASSSKKWNVDAGFTGYPVSIITGVATLTKASVAPSPTYLASDDTERTLFIGLDVDVAASDGLYRARDVTVKGLKTGTAVASVAFDGTNLAAGAYSTNQVYYSDDPMATTPTVNTARANKRPGIDSAATNEMVQVAWAGTTLIATSDGSEGAFATSDTNGMTFNDISLISTNTTDAQDVAVSPDGSVVYFVTDDNTDTSLWRYESSWQRVLALEGDQNYIVRVAPDDSNAVYVAKKGGTRVYYSADGGMEKWFIRTAGITIADIAVESADVVYAVDTSGSVVKSTNAGFTWGSSKASKLGNGYSITSVMEDVVLVGGTTGFVAYSTDGGSNFTKISKIMQSGSTNMVVVADADYANNDTIYAATTASGKNVKKFVVGVDDDWTDIFYVSGSEASLKGGIFGMAIMDGALYALEVNGSMSLLWQCLTPLTASNSSAKWQSRMTSSTSSDFDSTAVLGSGAMSNQGLVGAGGKLYAVKTNGHNQLFSFTDTLNNGGPSLLSPANDFQVTVNNVTGQANELAFSWSRLSRATDYVLYIAYDEAFTESVATVNKSSDLTTVVQAVGPNRATPADVTWQLGETYYWRVKVSEPLYSNFSETRSFSIEPGTALVPSILAPINGTTSATPTPSFSWSPVSGTTTYRFVLANNPQLTSPIVDVTTSSTAYAVTTSLAPGETYYWAVKASAPVEGAWSAIANFTVAAAPTATTPPVTVTQVPPPTFTVPPPPAPTTIVLPESPPPPAQIAPAYIWAVIIIGAILVIAVIILIVRTRRTV